METNPATPIASDQAAAIVNGEPVALPEDLYIPPQALEVFLRSFEGPLDLLLYLIRRKNLDILDIPIARITQQYIQYIELMQEFKLDLAAEYLLMAAMLAEIKSRMLLPRQPTEDEEEGDPRAELVRRLQEYEQFKQAAEDLEQLPRVGRDIFPVRLVPDGVEAHIAQPEVSLDDLVDAYRAVLARAALRSDHHVTKEALSVRDRIARVLDQLGDGKRRRFDEMFDLSEGRLGVVVTFLAVLELLKAELIELMQNAPLAPIYLQRRTND